MYFGHVDEFVILIEIGLWLDIMDHRAISYSRLYFCCIISSRSKGVVHNYTILYFYMSE